MQWWDVAADQLQPFLPFGLDATLSPTGDTIAVTTAGPVEISGDGQPLQELPAPENTDSSNNYLLLVDRVSGKALLPSLPTRYDKQFSPDGQYLAFYTTRQLLLDAEGRPTGDTVPGSTKQLNILDLTTLQLLDLTSNQLLNAIPVAPDYYPLSFLWSPDSRKILLRDALANLMVYDLQTGKLIHITVNGENQIWRASWSFDGQYLSFELYVDFETEKVVIIRVPEE
ncbi:MAG: PD40 domain-containing protein [Chloroflexi bacterium]|nr:PD40 domain-containing protein [Chloroflexota bacterium]